MNYSQGQAAGRYPPPPPPGPGPAGPHTAMPAPMSHIPPPSAPPNDTVSYTSQGRGQQRRRPSGGDASVGPYMGNQHDATMQGYDQAPPPPQLGTYAPPPNEPRAPEHGLSPFNTYESDVSSMATPVATPDFKKRPEAVYSPNEFSPPPSPADLYMPSPQHSSIMPLPTLSRPKSYLSLPMGGEVEQVQTLGGTSGQYAPPNHLSGSASYQSAPALSAPPPRSRTSSAGSIMSTTVPPPPTTDDSYKARSMDASMAMKSVYKRNVSQYPDPGSPGSKGQGSRGSSNFFPNVPQSPGKNTYSGNNNQFFGTNPPPSSPGGRLSSSKSRIDPSQMPRAPPPPKDFVYHTRAGLGRKVPPVSNAVFQSVDTGNCSPRHLRVTTTAPPSTSALAYKLGVPLALVATPFAAPENGEDPVPVVEMIDGQNEGEQNRKIVYSNNLQCNPVRCSRCKGYINPFVKWSSGGQQWTCNLCHMVNETPSWYFCSIDGSGLRVDRDSRPELSRGSVDFAVNDDYCVRPLQASIVIFCIDVSERAVSCGLTTATMQAVANLLQELSDSATPTQVGIISFSKTIQFYSIREESTEPFGIFSVSCRDPFCPIPSGLWIKSVTTHMDLLKTLLWRLPQLHSNSFDGDHLGSSYNNFEGDAFSVPPVSCPTATLVAVADGLKETGGKVCIFSANHSMTGIGCLSTNREFIAGSVSGTAAEFGLYGSLEAAAALLKSNTVSTTSTSGNIDSSGAALVTGDLSPTAIIFGNSNRNESDDDSPMSCFPEDSQGNDKSMLEGYVMFADWCGRHNVSVNFFMPVDGNKFKDIALYAEITRKTGGSLHPISGSLLKENTVFMLQQELSHSITSICGSEAVLKLRCSAGFRADDYIGQGRMSETATEAEIAWVNNDFTFLYTYVHESNLKDEDPLYLQLAILYTSIPTGKRLVRVHNMQLLCTTAPSLVFRNADLDCVTTVLFKAAIDKALRLPLNLEKTGPREFLSKCVFDVLYGYRTNCSAESPKSQLILPESLKILPLYVMSMLKHPSLLENSSLTSRNRPKPFSISGCERSFELSRLQVLPVREIINTLYPRLFALHRMRPDDGTTVEIGPEDVQLPRSIPCCSEILDSSGMYLLDDGMSLWVYIGRNMPMDELDELFEPNPAHLPPNQRPLMELYFRSDSLTDYSIAVRVSNIFSALKRGRRNVPDLKVLWADCPEELFLHRFSLRLVEDSIFGNMSYIDYLVKTHAKIQQKL